MELTRLGTVRPTNPGRDWTVPPVQTNSLPRVLAHPCPLTDGPRDKHRRCPPGRRSRVPQLCALAGNTPGLPHSKEAQSRSGLGGGLQRLCTQGNRGLSTGLWFLSIELGLDPCSQAQSFCRSTQSGSLPLTPPNWRPTPIFPKPSPCFPHPPTGGLANPSSSVSPVLTFSPLLHLGLQSL